MVKIDRTPEPPASLVVEAAKEKAVIEKEM